MRQLGQAAALLMAGLSGALAAPWLAQPDGSSVLDTASGLTWMRCNIGQRWQAPNCVGEASRLTWQQAQVQAKTWSADLPDALPDAPAASAAPVTSSTKRAPGAADPSAWRLPTVRELLTLIDRSRVDPATDVAVFPNTPHTTVWSATRNAQHNAQAWHIHFGHGGVYEDGELSQAKAVRLVRGSTPPALSDDRPASYYADPGDGSVTHRPSGLVWQRCLVGQSWADGACSGSASTLNWQAAQTQRSTLAGQTDWRLPTQDELLTLVDYTQPNRAINSTVFTETPGKAFWSATPHANAPQHGWYGVFAYDCAYYRYYLGSNAVVRLVRSGRGVK